MAFGSVISTRLNIKRAICFIINSPFSELSSFKFLSSSSKHSFMLLSNLASSNPSLAINDLASFSRSFFRVFKQSLKIFLASL